MELSDDRPEIFIGLVGAVGADLAALAQAIERELRSLRYDVINIKLSDLISDCPIFEDLKKLTGGPEDERINKFMDAGDQLRSVFERGDAVALLGLGKIIDTRMQMTGDKDTPAHSTAYLFNSLKHPDEIKLLRNTYKGHCIIISAYSPKEERQKRLKEIIAKSRKSYESLTHNNSH